MKFDSLRIAVVVPCYNEEKRLPIQEFSRYLDNPENSNIHLLFVNDGSMDQTITILQSLQKKYTAVDVLDLKKNIGKAEAIRMGVLNLNADQYDYIGYLDADLATPLEEISYMLSFAKPEHKLIMGSRVKLLGFSKIRRSLKRHYLGRIFSTFSSRTLGIPIYDTQCGAKLIKSEVCKHVFKKAFMSKWLFDIELIFRLKNYFPQLNPEGIILEVPLRNWEDVGHSKIKLQDFLKAPFELFKMYLKYKK